MTSGTDELRSFHFCPRCGSKAEPGDVFCSECGKSFVDDASFCTYCGTQVVPGNAFCSHCGRSLPGGSDNDSGQKVQRETNADTLTTAKRMSPIRWAIVVGFVACAVGVVLPWYSSILLSFDGINTRDGQFFAGVLGVAVLVGWWRLFRTNRVNGALLFLLWVGMFSLAIYEMVNVSTIFTASTMGSGLYVCAVGSAVGTVAAAIELSRNWKRDQHVVTSPPVWVPLIAGVVVVVALAGSAYGGYRHGTNINNSLNDALRSSVSSVSNLANSHSDNSGSGHSDNGGSGVTGAGATSIPGGGLTFTFQVSQSDWSQVIALVNSNSQNVIYHYTSGEDFLRANLCEDANEGPGSSDASGFLAPMPVEVGTSGGGAVFRVTLTTDQVTASDQQLRLNKCSSNPAVDGPDSTIQQDYTNNNSHDEIQLNISDDGGNSSEFPSGNSGSGNSANSGSSGNSGNSGTANSGSTGNT